MSEFATARCRAKLQQTMFDKTMPAKLGAL
jgi:hypothetical protein